MRILLLLASLFVASANPVFAQLAPYNAEGLTTGHFHMFVNDPAPIRTLFVETLGGRVTATGSLELISFPGIMVVLGKSAAPPTGGSDGSTVNHVGFKVKDLAPIKAKFAAAGLTLALDNVQAKQIIAVFPEGIRVEFTEDTALATPIAFHHFHLSTPNQEAKRSSRPRPFIITTMRVSAPTHGPTSPSASSIEVAFSAQSTQSTGPISSLLRTALGCWSQKSPSGLLTRKPLLRTASKSRRIRKLTSCPTSARRPP